MSLVINVKGIKKWFFWEWGGEKLGIVLWYIINMVGLNKLFGILINS